MLDDAQNPHSYMRMGDYILYKSTAGGVLFDPLTLQSVFIEATEMAALSASSSSAENNSIRATLKAFGFSFETRAEPVQALLKKELDRHSIPDFASRIIGLRILITDKCNLSCSYCFVHTNSGAADMSNSDLENGLTYLLSSNRNSQEVSVQWFGGEPTIRFDLMKYGDIYVDQKKSQFDVRRVRHSVVTNGTLLTDEMLEHYARFQYAVGVSVDGTPEINRTYRVKINGGGADDKILSNIRRLSKCKEIELGLVLTATQANIPVLSDVASYIEELGIKTISVNHPIPAKSGWFVDGSKLADALFKARLVAISKGGRVFSVLDKLYQSLDKRIPNVFEHLKAGDGIIGALLPGGKLSISNLNWKHSDFVFSVSDLEANRHLLKNYSKDLLSAPQCKVCPALAVCGGPSLNDFLATGVHEPIADHCKFHERALELTVWDNSGLQ